MGISFELSVPGKIILFGEHSVVYNKTAIAASLNLRTKLKLNETNDKSIRLRFDKLNIDVDISFDRIEKYRPGLNLNDFVDDNFASLNDGQKLSLRTFFHLFFTMPEQVFDACTGLFVFVDTELSVGAGVGSSASFSVAISTALLLYEMHKSGQDVEPLFKKDVSELGQDLKNEILAKSLSCEKIIHGTPSGIDHTTCLLGSMLRFVNHVITPVEKCSNMRILLVDTNIGRSTRKLVQGVRALRDRFPSVVDNVLNAMDQLAITALEKIQTLTGADGSGEKQSVEHDIGQLMVLNQNLLRTLGVSHKTLDDICTTAGKYDLPAKLTGAGGGGYAYIYIPSETDATVVNNLTQNLTSMGYHVVKTNLGGVGLSLEQINIL